MPLISKGAEQDGFRATRLISRNGRLVAIGRTPDGQWSGYPCQDYVENYGEICASAATEAELLAYADRWWF